MFDGAGASPVSRAAAARADLTRRGRRRIRCPVLVIWSADGPLPQWYADPLELWRPWAPDVHGHALPGGHFLPEERPNDVAGALRAFVS